MNDKKWLEPWRNEVAVHAAGKPVLELGCGTGGDSQHLTSLGAEVVAIDINDEALACCRATTDCLPVKADISKPLPFRDREFGFVLASLSLHYFSWQETLSAFSEIRRVMCEDGMLLLRVNSTKDVNYGAGVGEELEKNFFLYNGQTKRFFEKTDVEAALRDMTIKEMWHETIDRYGEDKRVWVAHASAATD